ncbi:DNA-directed RNA polymerase I subunit RPA1-like [Cucumis melo var. makuwa]|uniref:DNA-directed RNA polymerase I subunit RPA1-like n=1 Tax=Cucumis melo var. makuwa TaxID=1194695 RepID=A0A5A7U583_CUCMM|nr:DNA-directed RNA polymerase I subunit RPA1-like [Cucumis melo var. makuwa]
MALLFSFEGSTELTLEFSGLAVDPLSVVSIEGHNRVSGKGFPTTGPRIQAENVEIHRGLYVSDYFMSMDLEVTVQYVVKHWSGYGSWSLDGGGQCLNLYYLTDKAYGRTCTLRICASFGSTRLICASFGSTRLICASFGSTRLICASFGSTRLICASFGSTRLICASFGSTRLICASFGSTRLICAFYGTTRLLCRGTARGRPTRGRKDA